MKKFNRDDKSSSRSSGRFRDSSPKRFDRGDSPRFGARDSGRFERGNSEGSFEKRMFTVTCAKCNGPAEVPFRPRENKPVYCSDCFRKNGNYDAPSTGNFASRSAAAPSKSELDLINQKLDKIMEALDIE